MDAYRLSTQGKARYRRMRLNLNAPTSRIEGYEILTYLYENGPKTLQDITNCVGLSWDQVCNKISSLLAYGYIEGIAKAVGFFSY